MNVQNYRHGTIVKFRSGFYTSLKAECIQLVYQELLSESCCSSTKNRAAFFDIISQLLHFKQFFPPGGKSFAPQFLPHLPVAF